MQLAIVLFFFYAAKPSNFLPALPFAFHALARRRSVVPLAAVVALSVGHCFVAVDIFTSRKLTAPHLVPGHYAQTIRAKPLAHTERLKPLGRLAFSEPTVLVTGLWSWDFEYAIAKKIGGVQRTDLPGLPYGTCYRLPSSAGTVLLPRNNGMGFGELKEIQARGFQIRMERDLYREVYERSAVLHTTADRVERDGVSLSLVDAR